MNKQLYTNADLFYIILNKLKEGGLLPEILDYSLGCSTLKEIKSDEWDAIGRITFGGNEGIYLRIYIEGVIDHDYDKVELGTFKTLETSKEAYKAMSDLNVEFIFALRDFVEVNSESFCWTGYSVRFVGNGEPSDHPIWTASKKQAMKIINRHLEKHRNTKTAIVYNHETNTEEVFRREDLFV